MTVPQTQEVALIAEIANYRTLEEIEAGAYADDAVDEDPGSVLDDLILRAREIQGP